MKTERKSPLSLGPSSSKMWLNCRAAPGFIASVRHRLPPENAAYTLEGSEAHLHAAAALFLGYDRKSIKDTEMARHVLNYVEHVTSCIEKGDQVLIEQKVPLFYMEGRNGTVDFAALNPRLIKIRDLKYGAGVMVEAEDNTQMSIYARSLVEKAKTDGMEFHPKARVSLGIFQPRARDGVMFKEWSLSLTELIEFTDPIGKVAREIQAKPDKQKFHVADDVCQFCPAKLLCPSRNAALLDETPSDVSGGSTTTLAGQLQLSPAKMLTLEQLSKIVLNAAALRSWVEAAEEMAYGLLRDGQKVPGLKLVAGRGRRQWTDEDEARALLSRHYQAEEITTSKLISPNQTEELMKKAPRECLDAERIARLVKRVEGQPTMAPEKDGRAALATVNPLEDFHNLNDTTYDVL